MKALILFSGGLDSILAAYLMRKCSDVELYAVHFHHLFFHRSYNDRKQRLLKPLSEINIPCKEEGISREIIELVKNPGYGYGRNTNPCIDCKILMFRKAKSYMEKIGASFLVSGEVLGERPMSQRRGAFTLIENKADLRNLIFRPLSAGLLPVTIPEEKGWVSRSEFCSISGRSRKMQMELVSRFDIDWYPNPSGGCLLTDRGFSGRLKDLSLYSPDFSEHDVYLLKIGRHFRISSGAKLIVPKTDREQAVLLDYHAGPRVLFCPRQAVGRVALGAGVFSDKDILTGAGIAGFYTRERSPSTRIEVISEDGKKIISADPPPPGELDSYRV